MDIPIEVVKQELRLLYIGHYVNCSILCLAAYDFVITFGQEVAVVWRRKWTVTSTLLLGVRWLMVIGPVLSLISIPDSWCGAESILTAAIYMAGLALIALFSALRIYALWQDSRLKWVLAAAVLALLLVPVGTNLFAVVKNATEILILPPGLHICVNYINASPKLNTNSLPHSKLRDCGRCLGPRVDLGEVILSLP
ncbi:hypothetical protein PsYK624_154980 [Phanerochaete sordida]|uniref:DUF6533 domain-containing protein n=1 Tax=Phanerochaete sordida TaxID=48140 RepID=A0A9P3GQJ1_9APHY|nr:hypothetical protein PsYK624_154980 [Phanerochaete sordida]